MTDLPSQPYRVTALPTRKPMRFTFAPDAAGRAAIAAELGLLDLPELRLAIIDDLDASLGPPCC